MRPLRQFLAIEIQHHSHVAKNPNVTGEECNGANEVKAVDM